MKTCANGPCMRPHCNCGETTATDHTTPARPIYEAGRAAFLHGHRAGANPYGIETEAGKEWEAGWLNAADAARAEAAASR